ncbi:hypothetical protein B0H13DRAFT_2539638 [Mycena leptocephala]|nr:hypothetical protein B0H13DRAFT_2539638 [Mycena leptocephala]
MFDPMSSVVLSRASLIPLDNTVGPGSSGSSMFGATCLQVYLYFTKHCSRDTVFLKSFVVKYFLNFLLDLLSALVQFFYAYRIYTISNKTLVFPVIIGICSLAQLDEAFGIAYMQQAGSTAIQSFQIKFFKDTKAVLPYPTSSLGLEAGCDVLIAGAMIYHLLRNKTGFQKTNKAINLLVAYSLNSGALTSVFAICDLAILVALPSTIIFAAFFFILVRRSVISLNSRDHVRDELFSTSHAMITIPSYNPNPTLTADTENRTNTNKVSRSDFGMTGKGGSHAI